MVETFSELRRHIGHKIECVCYGEIGDAPYNVAIECVTCCTVLLDIDNPKVTGATKKKRG